MSTQAKRLKKWVHGQTYYICCDAQWTPMGEYEFVVGLVDGGRITPGVWGNMADIYLDFVFFQQGEEGKYTFMKKYENTSVFNSGSNDIDYKGLNIDSMWSVGIENIHPMPQNVEAQVIKDIFEILK
jgi:hypothetical protein